MTPLVSVGLPVYNGERYVRAAIESVLAQSFQSVELVIADNASTDRTPEICRAFADGDPRVRYFRHPANRGAGFNYNFVFHKARGEYFKWHAHDDLIAPTYLASCVEALNADPSAVLAYTHYVDIDEHGAPLRTVARSKGHEDNVSARFWDLMEVAHTCEEVFGLIRATVLRRTPLIANHTDSDRTLLGELALYGKFREIPQPLFLHRIHPQSSVGTYPVFRDRAAWFDPNLRGRLTLPAWRQYFQMLAGIGRAPLASMDRVACYWQALRWFKWRWRWMFRELFAETWHHVRQLVATAALGRRRSG